jgi:di/tricarboxylate transporter
MGIALTKTNAAAMIANVFISALGPFGKFAVLGGLRLTTIFLVQAINGAAVAAIIGPIAIQVAQQTNMNPRALTLVVALATSMGFFWRLGLPVSFVVMSPGGYNFRDFIKIGLPLTVILFLVVMVILPIVWQL